ncbi:MAG: Ig-like domain-containing protein [Flavobacteriales bacterium]|nr:Ig-like domain-containing protein [Flavobacteriales bacterium]
MGRTAFAIGLAVILSGCAQVGNVTGGEKDIAPPLLLSADPPNGSTRFESKVIRLEFNERIQLERVRERLLISPPLEEPPDVRVVGTRNVDIRLSGKLAPNTTYSFNMGECVKDLTEGNVATGAIYICSTGDSLDSLRVAGAVVNAFTGDPEKDMLVMLYAEGDSAAFNSGRPRSMTRCDALGVFSLNNLPEGRFQLYALRDKNANYTYDLPNEEIAFLDSALVLQATDSIAPVVMLRSFLPLSDAQRIRGSKVMLDGALQLILSRPADTITVRDVARTGGTLTWRPEWSTTRDTVLLWPNDTTQLSAGSYAISDGNTVLDTVRYRAVQRMPFNVDLTMLLDEEQEDAVIHIQASRPILRVDTSLIRLIRDSVELSYVMHDRTDLRTLSLQTVLPPGSSARITILPKAIHDIYGGTHDTLMVSLGRAAARSLGTLSVNLTGLEGSAPYLLQLLDQQQRIVREAALPQGQRRIEWARLAPGHFTLRVIADTNGNGHWDPGDWAKRHQPERTWYHPEPVNVRAAWDVVVDWEVQ